MGILDYWRNIVIEKENEQNVIATADVHEQLSIPEVIKIAIQRKQKLEIDYQKTDGTSSKRVLNSIHYNEEFTPYGSYIKGICQLRSEERTFKVARIRNAKIVKY